MKKLFKSAAKKVGAVAKKATAPVRNSNVWKFLRRTVLRSPFKGYFKSSWAELRKVTWPDRKTSIRLTVIVILFSAVFSVLTASLDYGFERLAKELFLK